MSEVKRYELCGFGGGLIVRAEGHLVDASDYDALKAERDALQQRLTAAEKRLGEAYEWGYRDGQNCPNGYSDEADRDKCMAELTRPAEGEGSPATPCGRCDGGGVEK